MLKDNKWGKILKEHFQEYRGKEEPVLSYKTVWNEEFHTQ
jgi:hypothetical protein